MTTSLRQETPTSAYRSKVRRSQKTQEPPKILCLVLSIGETSAPYNELCLAQREKLNFTICTYFRSKINPPSEIALFDGDNTLKGFFRALRSALSADRYDIVHAHAPHVGLFYLMATFGRRSSRAAATVFTVHSSFPNYTKLRHRLMLLPIFAFFQKVVCCSRASAASVPPLYRRLVGDRICFVQNGADIDRIDRIVCDQPDDLSDDRPFTIASVGRLIRVKNPLTLLDAFRQHRASQRSLLLIGEGDLRTRIEDYCKEHELDSQVELTGLIPREEVYRRLLKADVVVSTSHVEGLPVAVLEAMACQCPVILSDIPPHRELADEVDFIPLIPPNDVTGFAREISRFQKMSVSERRNIGRKCRKLVEDQFSVTAMNRKYSDIYHESLVNA